jgi:hypothetical protein
VFVPRRSLAREKELAGHLQVENEREAALESNEEQLAAPPDAANAAAAQGTEPLPPAGPEQGAIKELDGGDHSANDAGRERTGDGLDLGQLGHAAILAIKPGKKLKRRHFSKA